MIPKYRAAQLMAIVYVWGGGDESFTSAMDDCTLPSGFAIGIKASSILQLLGAISTENVRLEFSDPSRPLLLNA